MADVFLRVRLNPRQLRTVSDRRYADAEYLAKSGKNQHANGVHYIAGFVIECLLKAKLVEQHPILQNTAAVSTSADRDDQRRFSLCYRWHDLQAILEELPEIEGKLARVAPSGQLVESMRHVCRRWNIFARYSPQTATMKEASDFLHRIKELRQWLR